MESRDEGRASILGSFCDHMALALGMWCQLIMVFACGSWCFETLGLEPTRINCTIFWAIVIVINLTPLYLFFPTEAPPGDDTWEGGFWHREVDEEDEGKEEDGETACGKTDLRINEKE